MTLSDNLRKYLSSQSAQEILKNDNVNLLLLNSFTLIDDTTFKELVEFLSMQYGDLFGEIDTLTAGMFKDIETVGTVSLNGTVDMIPSQCFENSRITSLNAANVNIVAAKAFYNCKQLTSVNLPNLETIGAGAFANCERLNKFDLPKGIKKVGMSAFKGCNNLTELHYHGTIEEAQNIIWRTSWDGSFDNRLIKVICTDGEL